MLEITPFVFNHSILLPEVKVYSFYWFDIKKNTREEQKEEITPNSQNKSLQ